MIGEELKSNGLAQLEIVGSIYLAHSAFAQQTDNSISLAENRAGNVTRIIDRIVRLSGSLARVETPGSSVVDDVAATRTRAGVDADFFRAGRTVEVTGGHWAGILAESE